MKTFYDLRLLISSYSALQFSIPCPSYFLYLNFYFVEVDHIYILLYDCDSCFVYSWKSVNKKKRHWCTEQILHSVERIFCFKTVWVRELLEIIVKIPSRESNTGAYSGCTADLIYHFGATIYPADTGAAFTAAHTCSNIALALLASPWVDQFIARQ